MYEGRLVRLRDLRAEDAGEAWRWLNDLETARQVHGGMPMPIALEDERAWIEAHAGRKFDDAYHFGVETLEGRFIGVCSYHEVNWHSRTCMVGWFIGDPADRDRGYGTDLIRTLLKICFETLGMHKVSLSVFGYNERAVRLYERLGFVREGAYREQVFAMGRRWDEYRYTMFARDFERGGEARA